MKSGVENGFYLFVLLGIIFIPMASFLLPFQDNLAIWVFGDLVNLFTEDHLDFTSDTLGLNWLLLLLFAFSLLIGFGLTFTQLNFDKVKPFIRAVVLFYLASRMMVYGFDKVFKTQFYQPEPNLLYTPMGQLSKDILFWSAMGTSWWYCFLSGLVEVIAGGLLIWKRSRVFGLILTTFVLLHVLTINLGFDISVKLYSSFLLMLCLFLLFPHLKSLYLYFYKHEMTQLKMPSSFLAGRLPLKKSLKFLAVGLLMIEALKFPISTGYFNDDDVPRPKFHGAYKVTYVIDDLDGIDTNPAITRFFIHRRDYLILEWNDGQMTDHHFIIDTNARVFRLTDEESDVNEIHYRLYSRNSNALEIGLPWYSGGIKWFHGMRINHYTLPALQDEFHWTIDEFEVEE